MINIKKMVLSSLFTVLIIVGAYIRIPIPVIPFTLQVTFVLLAGQLLGAKWGGISSLLYLVMGLAGIPIFTQGGGLGYVLLPTFGYIIGFVIGGFVTGKITERVKYPSYKRLVCAGLVGLAAIYFVGMTYVYFLGNFIIDNPVGIRYLMVYCFLPTIGVDIVLCILSSVVAKRLLPALKR